MPNSSIDRECCPKDAISLGLFSIKHLCHLGCAEFSGSFDQKNVGNKEGDAEHEPRDASVFGEKTYALSRDFFAAQREHVTFLGDDVPRPLGATGTILTTKAGACFVKPQDVDLLPPHTCRLVTPRPYRAFVQVLRAIEGEKERFVFSGISPYAHIHPQAVVDPTCSIAPGAVISGDVVIGARSTIGPGTVIGSGVVIGSDTRIDGHVTLEQAVIGDHVQIQSGARVGHIGFGFVVDDMGFLEIPHQGKVLIHNHVHIGANTAISRGSFQNTEIGAHTRIDALVQIAHNVTIGQHVVIASQCGIAGSCVLGDGCFLGGQVGLANGVILAAGTKIAAKSGVMRSTDKAESLAGIPAVPVQQWRRSVVLLSRGVKPKA